MKDMTCTLGTTHTSLRQWKKAQQGIRARWASAAWATLFAGTLLTFTPGVALAGDDDNEPEEEQRKDLPLPVVVRSKKPIVITEHPRDDQPAIRWPIPAEVPGQPETPILLHRHSAFDIGGPGVASTDFHISGRGPLILRVSPGPAKPRIVGVILGLGGIALMTASLFTGLGGLAAGSSITTPEVGPPGWIPPRDQLYTASVVLFSLGLPSTIGGWVTYGRAATRFTIEPMISAIAPR